MKGNLTLSVQYWVLLYFPQRCFGADLPSRTYESRAPAPVPLHNWTEST